MNGNGKDHHDGRCATCTVPADVWQLGHRVLILERDVTNGVSALQALEERLVGHVAQLGAEVARLADVVAQAAKLTGGPNNA